MSKNFKKGVSILKRSIRLIQKMTPWYIGLLILQSAVSAFIPYIPIYMSAKILTELAGEQNIQRLIIYVVITIGVTLLTAIFSSLLTYRIKLKDYQFNAKYEEILNNKTYTMDFSKIERADINEHRSLIDANRNSFGGGLLAVVSGVSGIVQSIFSIIIAIGLSMELFFSFGATQNINSSKSSLTTYLSVLLFITIVVSIVIILIAQKKELQKSFDMFKELSSFNLLADYYHNSYLDENKAAKDIRIFNQAPFIKKIYYEELLLPIWKRTKDSLIYHKNTELVNITLMSIIGGLIYILVSLKAAHGDIEIGKVVQYYGAITKLIMGCSALMLAIHNLLNNNKYLSLFWDYLDIPSNKHQGKHEIAKDDLGVYQLEFQNVSFKYPGAKKNALEKISFKINSGEHVAIVGMNGSGKTTMIKLLCRLYEPCEGCILLNGKNIKEYCYEDYKNLFAVVFQDFKLFAFSVAQNIAADSKYDEDRVWNCLDMAGMKQRISELPKGISHTIYKDFDEDGIEISGGEEQKLAIARALYKNAPIVILDEPTAALDPYSEEDIYSKFEKITGNKTAIYISHRLSSCKFCDRIFVFQNGKIVQTGTHDELLQAVDGIYLKLWNAQAQYYDR